MADRSHQSLSSVNSGTEKELKPSRSATSTGSGRKKSGIFSKLSSKRGHQRTKSDDGSAPDVRAYRSFGGRETATVMAQDGGEGAGAKEAPAGPPLTYAAALKVPVSLGQKGYISSFPCYNLAPVAPTSGRKYCGFCCSHQELLVKLAKALGGSGDALSKKVGKSVKRLGGLGARHDYRVAGQGIATYPRVLREDGKEGLEHLIADGWAVHSLRNRILFGIADGIGHGEDSRNAALCALVGLLVHCASPYQAGEGKDESSAMGNVRQAVKTVVESFLTAQELVSANSKQMTTLTGGVLVRFDQDAKEKRLRSQSLGCVMDSPGNAPWRWGFVGASLGDCKLYRWCRDSQQVLEITSEDVTKVSVRDAGGHLGVECVMDNLTAFLCAVDDGDVLLCVSDGVHDNLDPETLRIAPCKIGLEVDSWRLVDPAVAVAAKQAFREQRLAQVIGACGDGADLPSPKEMVDRVLTYVHDTTSRLRDAEERGAALQRDWNILEDSERMREKADIIRLQKTAAGKYDHASCFAILVEEYKEPNPLTASAHTPSSSSTSSSTSSSSSSSAAGSNWISPIPRSHRSVPHLREQAAVADGASEPPADAEYSVSVPK